MSIPVKPASSMRHEFHHVIEEFVNGIHQAVEDAHEDNVSKKVLSEVATKIERLEDHANLVLREGQMDEETIIDAQIMLGIITQAFHPSSLEERDVSLLRAAKEYQKEENTDLQEVLRCFSENEEEREQLLMTIDHISHEVFLRCDLDNPPSVERKSA